ncbi:hypothetical protein CYMTET_56176 [Cymbomonas tetramitiformis]|uniref:Uncharacterized protein n=1 Tax=Cymbomonas tetramitiformis TaxID=36881 RepID=A0AAE0BCP3_9CHLO|nr:hypothetical protein CYMTET_56176 [Cymbomonas tetramitiformis]
MLGTAVVVAYLETKRVVRPDQVHVFFAGQSEAEESALCMHVLHLSRLACHIEALTNKVKWEFKGQCFLWYLTAFRVMMSTIELKTGWFYRCIIWNLLFLQQRDGSFRMTSALATVLAAGDTTEIITENPTGTVLYTRTHTPGRASGGGLCKYWEGRAGGGPAVVGEGALEEGAVVMEYFDGDPARDEVFLEREPRDPGEHNGHLIRRDGGGEVTVEEVVGWSVTEERGLLVGWRLLDEGGSTSVGAGGGADAADAGEAGDPMGPLGVEEAGPGVGVSASPSAGVGAGGKTEGVSGEGGATGVDGPAGGWWKVVEAASGGVQGVGLLGAAAGRAGTNVQLGTFEFLASIPGDLSEICATEEEAQTLWATMCAIERCHTVPFTWIINPDHPIQDRFTVTSIAEEYVDTCLTKCKASEDQRGQLKAEASAIVQRWTERRMEVLRNLKRAVTQSGKKRTKGTETLISPGRYEEEIGPSVKERRYELIEILKGYGTLLMNNHPWMKILVVQHSDPFTRSQQILVQATSILLLLVVCLALYYSKAALTCCMEFRVAVGCSAATYIPCRGHDACHVLMQSDPFLCEDFTCSPSEHLPGGFSCNAFPQNTIIDRIWMALFAFMIAFPASLIFSAMFIAGGKFRVLGSSNLTFLENLLFIMYILMMDSFILTQHLARHFTGILHFLDYFFMALQRTCTAAYGSWLQLRSAVYFFHQTRVLNRDPQKVFNEMQVKQRLTDSRQHDLAQGDETFEQVRFELDGLAVQVSYLLLMVVWGMITYTLLVYGVAIRSLMGSHGEKSILKAWIITLLFDNLGLQVIKSLTIKVWIKMLRKHIMLIGNGEERLAMWYEDYVSKTLPASYTSEMCEEKEGLPSSLTCPNPEYVVYCSANSFRYGADGALRIIFTFKALLGELVLMKDLSSLHPLDKERTESMKWILISGYWLATISEL